MVTYNIKDAPFNATGNGQKVIEGIFISNGTSTLTLTNDHFSSPADVGKYIAFQTNDTDSTDSNIVYGGTINSVTNAKTAVLTSMFQVSYEHGGLVSKSNFGGTSISGTSRRVEWGNDDSQAFGAFRGTGDGQTGVVLEIPEGRYCFIKGYTNVHPDDGSIPFFGCLGLTVISSDGYSTLASPKAVFTDFMGFGSGFFIGGSNSSKVIDADYSDFIDTVEAGAMSVQLQTPANYARYTVGKYVELTGFEVQELGDPSNPFFFEYPIIQSVTAGGLITFTAPLTYGYKSTWPHYGETDHPSGSGRAQIHVMNDDQLSGGNPSLRGTWDCEHVYEGIGFETEARTASFIQFTGRDITIKGGYFVPVPPIGSQNKNITFDGVDLSTSGTIEIDKQIVNCTIKNSTVLKIVLQSPSPDVMIWDNCIVTNDYKPSASTFINGTGKSVIIRNGCVFEASVQFGGNSYGGKSTSVVCSDSIFNGGTQFGGVKESNIVGVGFTINDGIISRVRHTGDNVNDWFVPGAWVLPADGIEGSAFGPAFQIIDVTESADVLYIQTSLTGDSFPAGAYSIQTHPGTALTVTNCSGNEEMVSWSNCEAGHPMYSRWNREYDENIGTTYASTPIWIIGKLTRMTFYVPSSYGSGTFNFAGPFVFKASNGVKYQWFPSINLATSGTRTITWNENTNEYDVVSLSGDTSLDPAEAIDAATGLIPLVGGMWLVDNQITPVMSSVSGSSGRSITLTIETDQGIPEEAVTSSHVYRSIEIHGGTYRYA